MWRKMSGALTRCEIAGQGEGVVGLCGIYVFMSILQVLLRFCVMAVG